MATKKVLTKEQRAFEKVWAELTPRQQKALNPKRFEKEKAAAAKAKLKEKAAAAKAKAAKKAPAKKTPAKKVAVSTRKTTNLADTLPSAPPAPPAEAIKPAKKSASKSKGKGQPRITEKRMVNGLDSSKTYLIVAEKPKGNEECQIGVRFVGNEYRIHAFPDFKSHGIDSEAYTTGRIRSPGNGRGQYQTRWVGRAEFEGFMNKLRESALHAHIHDDILKDKFNLSPEVEAVSA